MRVQLLSRGFSRLVFVYSLIALGLVLLIVIPLLSSKFNSKVDDMDENYVIAAKEQALHRFLDSGSFEAVYDSENKRFVDKEKARNEVKPYGMSKEHRGKYLFVKAYGQNNITAEWITPWNTE